MHVLFYINSLATGGAERTLVKLANRLVNEPTITAVTVVTQQPPSLDRFPLDPQINRYTTDTGATSTSVFSALSNNWQRIYRLRQEFRTRQPDIVVAFMATANTVATFAALGLNIPVVVSERNYPPSLPLTPLHSLAQRIANRLADHMVVLTQQTQNWYREQRGLTRISIIPNGVTYPIPPAEPSLSPSEFLTTQQKLLLCVGRISEQKQPLLALEAFARSAGKFPDWQMVWLGRGDSQELLDRAQALGISDQFSAPGAVGNVQEWYERADLYVMTSAFEGFPNSLLEAMACGCCSIALDCPTGPRDIIQHLSNGILLDPADHDGLAEQIASLMHNAKQRETLGQAALSVRETFNDAATHQAWLRLLSEVAAT